MTEDEKAEPLKSIVVRLHVLAALIAHLKKSGHPDAVEQAKAHTLDKLAEMLDIKIND